jgi:hypothetical protein
MIHNPIRISIIPIANSQKPEGRIKITSTPSPVSTITVPNFLQFLRIKPPHSYYTISGLVTIKPPA